ncbi:MAG: hypothetical protein ACYTGN_13795 [Planctomycetota bacterium]
MRTSLLALTVIAACSSPLKFYEGEKRPSGEIVQLKMKEILIHSVDGKEVGDDAQIDRKTIQILPGEHTVRIEWSYQSSTDQSLPMDPSGPRQASGARGERESLGTRYKRYYKDVRIVAKPGSVYVASWFDVPGEADRQPDLRKR